LSDPLVGIYLPAGAVLTQTPLSGQIQIQSGPIKASEAFLIVLIVLLKSLLSDLVVEYLVHRPNPSWYPCSELRVFMGNDVIPGFRQRAIDNTMCSTVLNALRCTMAMKHPAIWTIKQGFAPIDLTLENRRCI
jgi:hypothetical protein